MGDDQPAGGIRSSLRFRGYGEELRRVFSQLSAAFYDCQTTFAAIVDANVTGAVEGSPAALERVFVEQHAAWPPKARALVPTQSCFYVSTAAEHMGGLGALYAAAEEVGHPPPLLIRAVVEHAARVVWFLDPEIDARDRLAHAYLEELFSAVEYKKTIGRLAGKESQAYQDANEGLKNSGRRLLAFSAKKS